VITKKVFWAGFEPYFSKSLWRMSNGSRSKAFEIIRDVAKHYAPDEVYTDFDLDCILGEMNGGIEVEWRID
jgi:hypothetical protein